ncbi:MAG: mannose-1-phosphate guanylyltransferase [Pegethrix bostrychoides GSE-TBD4-15B]|jgi:mannose-1-phosphate guanylyltransferase|uniref:Mannose-1-phosphate guanylyltransferase n=1 Tax=Pegethrix bostrychoides GSE-TBD4-15B TaxID=2839662 RepID=A0A951PC43_9CYAN|nr:mannose-1-phosphate guanylyltransferase [Pegethrix bostrychoides GSE-TBD4-15B]
MIPVILAGGKGERFWPLSRKLRPKQFLNLDGSDRSLLQATADRLLKLAGGWSGLWVITAAHLEVGVKEQLPDLPAENLLVEVEGRDTAPAVAWATLEIARRHGEDAVVGFFPADHWIGEQEGFEQTIKAAEALAVTQQGIATLGIAPVYPAIGYGYIEQGERAGSFAGLDGYRVSRFTEKPDLATAEQFLATGRFSWNGGMFVFPAGMLLAELEQHAPEILLPLRQYGSEIYPKLPKLSIDYALMEKTDRAYVLPVSFPWDDLGDWNAIERLLKSESPNVELAQHVGLDTQGSLLYATDQAELIVTIGLEDLVVVRDGNVTLVVRKDRTQDIKQVLKQLQQDPNWSKLL